MDQNELKRMAAEAALDYVVDGMIVGVGTGSTVNFFIDALAQCGKRIAGAVSSSEASTVRLASHGISVFDLNTHTDLDLYVDGADESDGSLHLIKGGGGALTREKIVAAASKQFVCIADESKWVETLGRFPLPIEVLEIAKQFVLSELTRLGGNPVERAGFITDNGNPILDVHGLSITDPVRLEHTLNAIPGIVCNGLFAIRPADVLLLATAQGIQTHTRN